MGKTGRPRWGIVVAGIAAVLGGVLVIIVGLIVLTADQALSRIDSEADGRIPGEVSFEAEERKYVVVLGGGSVSDLKVSDTRCRVELADGTTTEVRGDRQGVSVSGAGAHSVGTFDAAAGRTTVECRFDDLPNAGVQRFSVGPAREGVRTAGIIVAIAGVFVILGGGGLMVRGATSRRA